MPLRRRRARRMGVLAQLGSLLRPGAPEADRQPRQTLIALGCAAAAAVFLLLRLFVPTAVGMGDQGDGNRVMCLAGVANTAPYDYEASADHVYTSWPAHTWYGEGCGADGSGEPYYSSQLLLVWPAKLITPLFGWGSGVDTRAVGIVDVLVFAALLGCFVALLPGRAPFRMLLAGLVTLVMADGVFADFFISPYSEAGAFLGVFATLVAMLFLWRRDRVDWLGIALVTVACAFAIGAKTQMIGMLPVVAVALLLRPYRARRGSERWIRPRGRSRALRRQILRRMPAVAAIVALTGFSGAYLASQPSRFTELNLYNAVFVEMLPHSPDPAADLAWFGLPQSMAEASGHNINSPQAAIYDPGWPGFGEHVTQAKVVVFYLEHPARFVSMADRGLDAITHPVLGYLGSYTPGSGHPALAKEHRVPVVQLVFALLSAAPALVVVLQLACLLLGLAVAARARLGARAVALGRAAVVFVGGAWLQFWAVMLSEGASEIYKHMIVVGFMTAISLVLIVALVALLRRDVTGAPPGRRRADAH